MKKNKKIESLTQEQIDRFPSYVKKWVDIGLSTAPLDKIAVGEAVKKLYSCGGLKAPEKIIYCGSPLSMFLTIEFLKKMQVQKPASVGDSVYGQHEAGRLSFYDFFGQEFKELMEFVDKAEGIFLLAKACGRVYPTRDVCFVSSRPKTLNRDERGRLHGEKCAAMEYGGTGVAIA